MPHNSKGDLVPLRLAQPLIGRVDRPAAKSTILGLALQKQLDVRLIAGRYVVEYGSIVAYRARKGLPPIRK